MAVTFESGSRGQVSMIIYEWGDVQYLGKVTSLDEDLPVSLYNIDGYMSNYGFTQKTYIW